MKRGIKTPVRCAAFGAFAVRLSGVPALADGEDVREEGNPLGAGKTGGKEEVVYATLGADGSVSGVYVVNVLRCFRRKAYRLRRLCMRSKPHQSGTDLL